MEFSNLNHCLTIWNEQCDARLVFYSIITRCDLRVKNICVGLKIPCADFIKFLLLFYAGRFIGINHLIIPFGNLIDITIIIL